MSAQDHDDDIIRFDDPDDLLTDDDPEEPQDAAPLDDTADDPPAKVVAADSPMARLQAAAQAKFEQDTKAFRLPGFGIAAMELGILGKAEGKRLRKAIEFSRAGRGNASALDNALNDIYTLLQAAAVGLCFVDDGQAIRLYDDGERIGWAGVTDLIPEEHRSPQRSERQGVIDAFRGGKDGKLNESSLLQFARNYNAWVIDTAADVDGAMDLVVDDQGNFVSESIHSGS